MIYTEEEKARFQEDFKMFDEAEAYNLMMTLLKEFSLMVNHTRKDWNGEKKENGNVLVGFYMFETLKAVKFGSDPHDTHETEIQWVPKSVMLDIHTKDYNRPQKIRLKPSFKWEFHKEDGYGW
ncbi:MAG: hypothetical protein GY853_01020 [PVC group bacterium]|nr:hypothetical protein [PVC group bacterium]